MRTGIMGGTFNPVHNGHLITAQAVKEIRSRDKIIFVPNNISPFKENEIHTAPEHRLNMLRLALENVNGFEISGYEINKPGISYTADTLHYFKNLYEKIEFIMGYDSFTGF